MGSLVLTGDTSGSVTVAVPLVAGSNTATLAAATGTHFPFSAGTAVNSTSGTSIDFTSIPSWVKRITVMLSGVSTNGSSIPTIRLGTGGTPATTGYLSVAAVASQGATTSVFSTTDGFGFYGGAATYVQQGSFIFTNISGNSWVCQGMLNSTSGITFVSFVAGSVTLGGVLNMVRITTTNGTDTFDAGSINILFE